MRCSAARNEGQLCHVCSSFRTRRSRDPESTYPVAQQAKWIPGSALSRSPGMTESSTNLRQQRLLRRMRHVIARRRARVAAIGVQQPGLGVVGEVILKRFGVNALRELHVDDREAYLDAAQQVAFHPVRAGAVDFRVAAVGEPVHAAVFEKAADDRTHANVFRNAWYTGPQRAGA